MYEQGLTSCEVMPNPTYFPLSQKVMRKAMPRAAMLRLAA